MSPTSFKQVVTALSCLALVAGPLPVRAEETIRCTSHRFGYQYCPVDTGDRVNLVSQHSYTRCERDQSWGYDRHGVWVDRGCDADFRVGGGSHDRRNAVVAGAALVGLAALLASSANKQAQAQAHDQDQQDGWAVGTFSGYDEVERTEVQLTILPGGSVNGRAGRVDFTGSFKATRLEAGRHVFRVQRSGNGFIAIDEVDARHRVVFQRSGSGY